MRRPTCPPQSGTPVRTIAASQSFAAGSCRLQWDGADDAADHAVPLEQGYISAPAQPGSERRRPRRAA